MVTSSKVTFKLDELRRQALTALDERISTKVLEVEQHSNQDRIAQRLEEWRIRQIAALEDIYNRRFDIDDVTLSRFRLEELPRNDSYARERAERELQSLQARRAKIVAKSGALVPDENGSIALTKTQLAEFFDL